MKVIVIILILSIIKYNTLDAKVNQTTTIIEQDALDQQIALAVLDVLREFADKRLIDPSLFTRMETLNKKELSAAFKKLSEQVKNERARANRIERRKLPNIYSETAVDVFLASLVRIVFGSAAEQKFYLVTEAASLALMLYVIMSEQKNNKEPSLRSFPALSYLAKPVLAAISSPSLRIKAMALAHYINNSDYVANGEREELGRAAMTDLLMREIYIQISKIFFTSKDEKELEKLGTFHYQIPNIRERLFPVVDMGIIAIIETEFGNKIPKSVEFKAEIKIDEHSFESSDTTQLYTGHNVLLYVRSKPFNERRLQYDVLSESTRDGFIFQVKQRFKFKKSSKGTIVEVSEPCSNLRDAFREQLTDNI